MQASQSIWVMSDIPRTGDVFNYTYLWHWQDQHGEISGRKNRPCCMAFVVEEKPGRTVMFILPITTQPPSENQVAVAIPNIEARRAGLDHTPSWIIVDELNVDVYETSYALEDRQWRGAFSSAFVDHVLRAVAELRKQQKLKAAKRR